MIDAAKVNIIDTIKILATLDNNSLLLIDSGARLLAARQEMENQEIIDQGATNNEKLLTV